MTELKYVGTHQPFGMIIDIKEEEVEKLLDSGEYEQINIKKIKKKVVAPIGEDDDSLF